MATEKSTSLNEQTGSSTSLNERLAEHLAPYLPPGLRLEVVPLDQLVEQDINAQSMPKPMFEQLVTNIKNAGGLESFPLCVRTDRGVEIISGHHRVRAARSAKLAQILCLVYESLSRARIHANQLAHNTISGSSDPQTVEKIYTAITDVAARFEAYVDPRIFDSLPKPVVFKAVDIDMLALARPITIAFLASQRADYDKAVERLLPDPKLDTIYLAAQETFDGWRDALRRVREERQIVAIPTAVAEMARLALERLDQLKAEQEPASE